MTTPPKPGIVHVTADFLGAPAAQLGDQAFISGIMVSAAGAAGMNATGSPTVIRHHDGALTVILPADGCHLSIHTMPAREVAILDVIAQHPHDPQRALDVVARRLTAQTVRAERRMRGV